MPAEVYTLINSQNGNLAFKIFSFDDNSFFDHVQRHNYYSIVWIKEGSGKLRVDVSEYDFESGCMFFFSPY
jgi:AraC family transcriptional regulator, transcriptional activator of pobA